MITQYVDDTPRKLDGSPESILNSLITFGFLFKLSGQKKSSKKSGYGQESFQIECFTIYDENFNWGCTTFNLLGIKLSAELKENVDLD